MTTAAGRGLRRRHALARFLLVGPLLLGGAAATVIGGATPAWATSATLYVATSGSGTTCNQVSPCASIKRAITTATGGSYAGDDVTIEVAAGTYTENDTINASSLASRTIEGAGQGSTVVDGNEADPVFGVQPGTAAISGLTIENGGNGNGSNNGGGIDSCDGNTGCQLSVTDSTFTNDDAPNPGGNEGDGGAIDNGDNGGRGSLTVTGSTFGERGG